ncbi:LysR substrate-binding domain-containing protein [Leucobacter chromiiresistens]|uniref:LysR family transcriptional regulator n=1 Tax=Leucobacter chromiiresistens TaxID=1079994 RepID=A0A147EPU9_9MICO|nr:LysR substrate-binding domain-containing protein [Leucobacter chromiiresistens]KTR86420.1 LysR family transcriptional regulator [Leucobacter chromiiresistens]
MSDTTTAPDPGAPNDAGSAPAPIRLGFARGIAPSKWARRWKAATPGRKLELVPLEVAFGTALDARNRETAAAAAGCDVLIERTAPSARPSGSDGPESTRRAIRLYAESMALVVPADHELAQQESVSLAEIAFVELLDHPDHDAGWPEARPWDDPEWMPKGPRAALALVATGAGAVLLPVPLARHLIDKREHTVLPIRPEAGEQPLDGPVVWAVWNAERDDATVQHLAGILRGRTANSSRESAQEETKRTTRAPRVQAQPKKQAPKLKPNSRGAQLQAAKEKAERKKAEARQAKRRKRR